MHEKKGRMRRDDPILTDTQVRATRYVHPPRGALRESCQALLARELAAECCKHTVIAEERRPSFRLTIVGVTPIIGQQLVRGKHF